MIVTHYSMAPQKKSVSYLKMGVAADTIMTRDLINININTTCLTKRVKLSNMKIAVLFDTTRLTRLK
jgi:hypothetical protein